MHLMGFPEREGRKGLQTAKIDERQSLHVQEAQ